MADENDGQSILDIAIFRILASITLIFISFILIYRLKKSKRVCIIVLGDVGRSPRMMYHSLSLASHGFIIDIVGFEGSPVLDEIKECTKINLIYISPPISKMNGMPSTLRYIIKTVLQSFQLAATLLFKVAKPQAFFIQNPPSIPSLAVAFFVGLFKGSSVIIDWHNYGYTILGLNLRNRNHFLVKCAYLYEGFFGMCADKNICVTEAMQQDLLERWNIKADVMYDRPPFLFKELTAEEKHNLFMKLAREYIEFREDSLPDNETNFTRKEDNGIVTLKDKRPALLISSTSWTDDEDFSLLLDALTEYEATVENDKTLPKVLCCITGKGPQKEYYIAKIKAKKFSHVSIITPWLTHEDYPKLIGAADLGVCLHFSSSGLDLPMKVVDMFGCRLPVCAMSYNCLDELVKHNENGFHFKTPAELADHIKDLFHEFHGSQSKLKRFRENLEPFQHVRWNSSWNKTVQPLFSSI